MSDLKFLNFKLILIMKFNNIITMIIKNLKILSLFIIILFLILSNKIKNSKSIEKNINEKEHIEKMTESSAECTLFLNKNDEFPIEKPCNVLLIGSGARNTLKGGLGSGDVESRYYTTCEQGLEKAGFKITSKEWLEQYPILKEKKIYESLNYFSKIYKAYKGNGFSMISYPEYDLDISITEEEKKAEIAIYVLARNSGEGADRRLIKGDILLTDNEIKDILYLNKNFKKFMLVLNVVGVVDLSPVKEVSNILFLSQLGVATGDILADIILGKQNPSGKLSTTWSSINDYKFINDFGKFDETNYLEGVYVGYRFFDSEGIKPLYPFGFGQSYTSFEIYKISIINVKDEITINVKVINIVKFPGKEVVQVYVSPSQENVDKPYQSLVSFKKTPKLKPSNEIEISLSFRLKNIARYDEKKACYILDKGNYIIRVGNSSKNTNVYGYIELDEDIITEQLKNIVSNPDFEDYKAKIKIKEDLTNLQKIKLSKNDFIFKTVEYQYKFDKFPEIEKLKNEELAKLCIGNYEKGFIKGSLHKEMGLAGLTTMKIQGLNNYLAMADGPAGLRISKIYGIDYKGSYNRLSEDVALINSYNYAKKQKKISLSKAPEKKNRLF